jgi:hypothetical protein
VTNLCRRISIVGLALLSATAASQGATLTTDGSAAGVQAAVNQAKNGDTVIIPAGSYVWRTKVSISGKAIALKGSGTVTITNQLTTDNLIDVGGSKGGNVEIANLHFKIFNQGPNYVFTLNCARDTSTPYTILVHDCTFDNSQIYNYAVRFASNGIVMWKCTFICNGMLGGISFVVHDDSLWNTPDTMGAADTSGLNNSYVEDCTFYDSTTACLNLDDDSRVVIRHCTFNNAAVGSHGQETSIYGVRHWEFYNDDFIYSTSGTGPSGNAYPLNFSYWFQCRGGTGVITQCQADAIPWGKAQFQLNVFSINRADSIPCQVAYPAARQTGFGWSASSKVPFGNPAVTADGLGQVSDPIYVWGNSGTATSAGGYVALNQYTPDDCGNNKQIGEFLKQGRDYFVNVAKPGWKPYTYPHPLRGGTSTATATPTPVVSTATPTPTPIPVVSTATPTPTPSFAYSGWETKLNSWMSSNGFSATQVKMIDSFVQSTPPHLDSQNSYYQWQGELNWYLQQEGFSASKITGIDQFVESTSPQKN